MTPSSPIAFVGRLTRSETSTATVRSPGHHAGYLTLDLDEWDQLRDDVRQMGQPSWVTVIANDTLAKARPSP